jgi:hypothetical protein
MAKNISNFFYWSSLVALILIFIYLHFFGLTTQEFMGDEASPMILIDRMWDGIEHQDMRFLAYPFLFYQDPFRAPISGTLSHFFGPDRIILRLPNILFDLATGILLILLMVRARIARPLQIFLLASYITGSHLFIARLAGGDAQFRFFFLLCSVLLYETNRRPSVRRYCASVIAGTIALLTMLNALALVPFGVYVLIRTKLYTHPKAIFITILTAGFFLFYFIAWTVLPLYAYKSGFQDRYKDRGLWYYITRVSEPAQDHAKSYRALVSYSSMPFALLLILTIPAALFLRDHRELLILIVPAWLSVFALSRPSLHIVMFIPLFFWHTTLITEKLSQKSQFVRIGMICVLILCITSNLQRTVNGYMLAEDLRNEEFVLGHIHVPRPGTKRDEAVRRLYEGD